MILISHRGNLSGRLFHCENMPLRIENVIAMGYDVEIDLRVENGFIYLGHDKPEYNITFGWLKRYQNHLWIHCKNYAAIQLISKAEGFRWFCHQDDTFGIVSDGSIWYSDLLSKPHSKCIIPLLTREQVDNYPDLFVLAAGGICSDYIQEFR